MNKFYENITCEEDITIPNDTKKYKLQKIFLFLRKINPDFENLDL